MGTRATITIKKDKTPLVKIYTQYDGYPSGVVLDIVNKFKDRIITNGFSDHCKQINLPESFAILVCAHLVNSHKKSLEKISNITSSITGQNIDICDLPTGTFYIEDISSSSDFLNYEYDLILPNETVGPVRELLKISVNDFSEKRLFTVDEYIEFCKSEDHDE